MPIFSSDWYANLNLRKLGCKWTRCNQDRQKYRLAFSTMKGLGAVWAAPKGSPGWCGTDGRDAASLALAKANVEKEVRKALQSELEILDEALKTDAKPGSFMVSALAVAALEFGLREAVFRQVTRTANAENNCVVMRNEHPLPESAMVGISVGRQRLAFAAPKLPEKVCCLLGIQEDKNTASEEGVIEPIRANTVVQCLGDLVEQCEQSVAQATRQADTSLLSFG